MGKGADLSVDGDPDEIHIRLSRLSHNDPDILEPDNARNSMSASR